MKINSQPHGNVSVVVAHGPLIAEELIDLRRAVQTAAAAWEHPLPRITLLPQAATALGGAILDLESP